jgi:metallophosphoesterase superfamily enzyme
MVEMAFKKDFPGGIATHTHPADGICQGPVTAALNGMLTSRSVAVILPAFVIMV